MVLARGLECQPRVLVAANPTQGLDIRATNYVHQRLVDDRAEGGAIVLISQDLDELLTLCDRIVVLYRGDIPYESRAEEISMDSLAIAMGGGAVHEPDGQQRTHAATAAHRQAPLSTKGRDEEIRR